MSSARQFHSAKHDSDNVYHTYYDCQQAENIHERCWCTAKRPSNLCQLCSLRQK